MPGTGSNRTTQEDLLRTVYLDRIRQQFNAKSILLQIFSRNERNYAEGKEISISLHSAPGEGPIFNRSGYLPAASHEQVDRATFNYMMMEQVMEVDGDFIEAAASQKAGENSPVEFQTRALARNGRYDLNYQLFGDGSAKVGQVATATASTTLTVDSLRGLRNNLRVDVLLNADGQVGGGVVGAKITINRSTNTVTLTGGATMGDYGEVNANAADYGLYKTNSYMQAPFGLDAIISDANPPALVGNYGNVDRSLDANDFYRASVLDNGGVPRSPSLELFEDMVNEIDDRSEGETNLIVTGKDILKALKSLLVADKRYDGDKMKLNGWCDAVLFNSTPIVADKHCPPDKAFFLDTGTFTVFQNSEGTWMDKDGSVLARVPGKVAYNAAWYRRLQLVCETPAANGVIEDLAYLPAA